MNINQNNELNDEISCRFSKIKACTLQYVQAFIAAMQNELLLIYLFY